ncbi:Sodium-dependent phosphate transport protein 2B [Fragariocoptes setiger]|uniref:Sodium-dependent phosphate transport protein 2B n=1 Tax=Fragariocoptes setiger TaxID=1670756 RepID=A0ABQ7SAC0_9ACAR|nr:Sodium-dependent phosphate transport protein 2B [Fragariocoptes setiger]
MASRKISDLELGAPIDQPQQHQANNNSVAVDNGITRHHHPPETVNHSHDHNQLDNSSEQEQSVIIERVNSMPKRILNIFSINKTKSRLNETTTCINNDNINMKTLNNIEGPEIVLTNDNHPTTTISSITNGNNHSDAICADANDTKYSLRPDQSGDSKLSFSLKLFAIFSTMYFFMWSSSLLSEAFKLTSVHYTGHFFRNTGILKNPLLGLMVGIATTVIVQSSGAITSVLVTMVGSGVLTVRQGIPIIMGANVGTSVTNTIVSLVEYGNKKNFGIAITAGIVHDMQNVMTVIFMLPLELLVHFLERSSDWFVNLIGLDTHTEVGELQFLSYLVKPLVDLIIIVDTERIGKIAPETLIDSSVSLIKRCLREETIGMILTIILHSSGVFTSMLVPLAGGNVLSLIQIYELTLGSNVGTTTTGIIAALSAQSRFPRETLQVALCHCIFNVAGIVMFYAFPYTKLPLWASKQFDSEVLNLKLDIEELERLRDQATRANVKAEIKVSIENLDQRRRVLEAKINDSSRERIVTHESFKPFKTYGWDEDEKKVNIYAMDLPFEVESVDMKFPSSKEFIATFMGHRIYLRDLNAEVDPEKSTFKIGKTKKRVSFHLVKKVPAKWWSLESKEKDFAKFKKDKETEEDLTAGGDPQESLTKLMKKMYDEGDDDMKRMIKKSFAESQSKMHNPEM